MNQGLTQILSPAMRNAHSVSLRWMPDRVSCESTGPGKLLPK